MLTQHDTQVVVLWKTHGDQEMGFGGEKGRKHELEIEAGTCAGAGSVEEIYSTTHRLRRISV